MSEDKGKGLTIVALGGNALIDPERPPTVQNQLDVTKRAMEPVADLVEAGERVLITHGNGPQVGFMALRAEIAKRAVHEVPLDSLVADTQGSLGYMMQHALRDVLHRRGLRREVATVLTEIAVDPDDDAFREPTKPIGMFHTALEAELLEQERGWRMVEDAGRGHRRVVPSPAPVSILQLPAIEALVERDFIVICCGGGGIPVVLDDDGFARGIEGVIDKDRASALLGVRLGAARLVITTAVDGVYDGFGTDEERLVSRMTFSEAEALLDSGTLPAGSMAPKVKACHRFLKHGAGREAIICRPDALMPALRGEAGTHLVPDPA